MSRASRARLAPLLLACGVLAATTAALTLGARRADGGVRSATPAPALEERAAPRGVGIARCDFRDPSRTTYDYSDGRTIPGRNLPTEIRYPTSRAGAGEQAGAPPADRGGPLPTVFFAPGYDVTPDTYAALLDAWVRAGFVVVAPTFPDTNPAAVAAARTGDAEDDVVNQPADVAFLVRAVRAAAVRVAPGCRIVHGLVDVAELGVAGQSDGGETVAALAYDRAAGFAGLDGGLGLRAAIVMSGAEIGDGPYEAVPGDPALLVVQSATDRCNPPQDSTTLYDSIVQRDRWFLALRDADHLPPYDGGDPSAFAAVVRVTTRFLALELHAKVPAAGFLAFGNATPSIASLSTGPSAPPLAALEPSVAACYAR